MKKPLLANLFVVQPSTYARGQNKTHAHHHHPWGHAEVDQPLPYDLELKLLSMLFLVVFHALLMSIQAFWLDTSSHQARLAIIESQKELETCGRFQSLWICSTDLLIVNYEFAGKATEECKSKEDLLSLRAETLRSVNFYLPHITALCIHYHLELNIPHQNVHFASKIPNILDLIMIYLKELASHHVLTCITDTQSNVFHYYFIVVT